MLPRCFRLLTPALVYYSGYLGRILEDEVKTCCLAEQEAQKEHSLISQVVKELEGKSHFQACKRVKPALGTSSAQKMRKSNMWTRKHIII